MIFLPIVERELRAAARQRGTYRMRSGAALLAIVIGGWMLLTLGAQSGTQRAGREIFQVLSTLAFIFCLFVGARTTADCISTEKREGTLGLLFLTDLKGYDIVLGKLAATSLGAIYSLLAIFPVLALPLLMGGVAPAEFGRVMLVLTNTLLFSLTAGMLVSALVRQERMAALLTLGLILFVAVGLPIAGFLWSEFVSGDHSVEPPLIFALPSPFYAFGTGVFAPMVRADFGWSLLVTHALSWIFLLLAMRIVPQSWHDKAVAESPRGPRAWWRRFSYGSGEARRSFRARLLEANPVLWLSSRNRLLPRFIWTVLLLGALAWLWGYVRYPADWLEAPIAIITALAVHTFLKLYLGSEACRRFAEDRQQGALELMLSTPLTVREILRGQQLALQRVFLGPIIVALVADALLLLGALRATRFLSGQDLVELSAAFGAGMMVLVADAVTLSWVGMWHGLAAKNLTQACGHTFGRVLVLPWTFFIGSLSFYLGINSSRVPKWNFTGVLVCWLIVAIITDIILFVHARHRLCNEFRHEAARRFERGRTKRWWRFWTRAEK